MKNKKVFLIPNSDYKDINPIDGGYQICPPEHEYGPTARTYTILHYVVSGEGVLIKNGKTYKINPSQCFIIRSGEVAYYSSDSNNPWTYIWLGFKTDIPLPYQIDNEDVIDGKKYKDVFLPLMEHKSTDKAISSLLCSKCWELFFLMNQDNEPVSSKHIFKRAKNYIENKFMEDISIADIASMMCMDRTVFSKGFSQQYGLSPQEYLCSHRLKISTEMLENTNTPITEIAVNCGYGDYPNFSKMFKKRYGISPREYRKEHSEEK